MIRYLFKISIFIVIAPPQTSSCIFSVITSSLINDKLSFNISYSSDLTTNPVSAGLGITGLDTLVTNDLAVNLTI